MHAECVVLRLEPCTSVLISTQKHACLQPIALSAAYSATHSPLLGRQPVLVCTSKRCSAELCATGSALGPKRSPVRPRVQAALTAPAPVYVLGGSIVPLGAAGFNVTSQARARSA